MAGRETHWTELDLLEDLASTMRQASARALGQMTANPVASAMRYFPKGFAKRVERTARISRQRVE